MEVVGGGGDGDLGGDGEVGRRGDVDRDLTLFMAARP